MNNLNKRLTLGMVLGLFFGLVCFSGFVNSPDIPESIAYMQTWSFNNPMMWSIIFNRFVLGLFVAISGFINIHPTFYFKIPSYLRGAKIGILVSLLMAIGSFIGNEASSSWITFWIIIGFGVIIGSVIDLIITRVAGEGKDLIIESKK